MLPLLFYDTWTRVFKNYNNVNKYPLVLEKANHLEVDKVKSDSLFICPCLWTAVAYIHNLLHFKEEFALSGLSQTVDLMETIYERY